MSQRIAIVTGAGQGIGRSIALRLAKDGLDVVLNDLPSSSEKLNEVVSEIKALGRRGVAVTGDASIEGDVENLVAITVEKLGGLDVFVANAGINLHCPLIESTVEQWEKLMNINARGVFLGYRAAAEQMVKQGRGGRIIGACSIAGKKGNANYSIYTATKFAVRGLTQSAAAELGPHGITVNAYAPGTIDTPMVHNLYSGLRGTKYDPQGQLLKIRAEQTPVGSLGTPEDIAGLVSYLVSEESRFITGQAININGGTLFD